MGHPLSTSGRVVQRIGAVGGVDGLVVGRRGAGLGAEQPVRTPRLAACEAGAALTTETRGAANAKAKRELGWRPRHPSWQQGFAT
jgi:hypothetical protein